MPSALLAEALDEVMAESSRRGAIAEASPSPPAKVPSAWLAAALGSWLVMGALLLFRPAFARGPNDRPWQPAPAVADASIRYGMWLARGRIEGFARANGRLPSFIGEAGMDDSALGMVATGEHDYILEGRHGRTTLQLHRRMNADSFLGGSLAALRRR